MINTLRRMFGHSDHFGLRHDLSHLSEMQRKIVFLSRKEQAKYSDQVCRDTVNDPDFLQKQFEHIDINDTAMFRDFNATSVGNLAYLSLNACLPEIQGKADIILMNYKQWLNTLSNKL